MLWSIPNLLKELVNFASLCYTELINIRNYASSLESESIITRDSIDDLERTNRAILKVLRLRQPGLLFLNVISQDKNMLNFNLTFPPPGASDVVKRNLFIRIGTNDPESIDYPADATESKEFQGYEGWTVAGTLVDVDDAGNQSQPREFNFNLADTIAPPKPGELGLSINSES